MLLKPETIAALYGPQTMEFRPERDQPRAFAAALKQAKDAANARAATFASKIDGLRLLLDPVFAERVSPLPVGPRRFHAPPIALADLPPIDAVLISHDHYDHLDMGTVRQLAGAERDAAIDLFTERYPFLKRAVAAIVIALRRVNWYELRPERLYFVDNSRGFGHRDEITGLGAG